MNQREDCRSCDNLLDQVTRLSSENAKLRADLKDTEAQAKDAAKLLQEFTTNQTVCMALGPTCIGGHQEDPCKCLYCRTRHQLSMMD